MAFVFAEFHVAFVEFHNAEFHVAVTMKKKRHAENHMHEAKHYKNKNLKLFYLFPLKSKFLASFSRSTLIMASGK